MPSLPASARAAILMSAAALLLSLVPLFVKLIPPESGIPVEEKILARALVALVITWILAVRSGTRLRPSGSWLILLRSATGTCGMVLYFSALHHLPLADAVTLNRLSPFFVLLFSFLFLGERLGLMQIIAMAAGFAGAAVVLQPGRVPVTLPGLLALLSAVAAGGAYTTLRALRSTDPPLRIVFWFSLLMTVLFLPGTVARGTVPGTWEALALLGIGVSGAAGQLLMTAAYRHAPGGEVAIYGYLSVVYAVVWQLLFFDVLPQTAALAGGALVISGGVLNYLAGRRRSGRRRFPAGVPGFGGILGRSTADGSGAPSRGAGDQPQPPP